IIDLNTTLGSYAAKVLDKANEVIDDIIEKCSKKEEFISKQTQVIINYIKNTYKDVGDHPWEDENIVIRHKSNKKWYALLMVVSESKFKSESSKEVEVLNLKSSYPKDIIDNKNIFPAYHMSKKNWISIILDGNLANEIIYSLIDMSYELTK
ncbi:MAG: MmcQ/YjbR family DNA-binding protein, partial [Bacilli bacterium]|nr:MmcQ/YjbR family DNA-binding protein [Bacilli bacterium]